MATKKTTPKKAAPKFNAGAFAKAKNKAFGLNPNSPENYGAAMKKAYAATKVYGTSKKK